MDKAKLSQILGHQLKGIMLHSDLCKAYLLKKNKRCAFTHYIRTLAETKTFLLTNEHIIDEYDCAIEPTRETQIVVPAEPTDGQLLDLWQSWENDTMKIYQQAIQDEPSCKFWLKLYRAVKREYANLVTNK